MYARDTSVMAAVYFTDRDLEALFVTRGIGVRDLSICCRR